MKLVSIPEFTTGLISTLEKKNLATDFRKKIVKPKNTEKGATGRKKNPTTPAKIQNTRYETEKNCLTKSTKPNVAPLELRMRTGSRS